MQTDAELLLAAQSGDEEAFEVIVQRYSGLIWRGYKYQSIRIASKDWQHEARIVLFYCLQRIKDLQWGVLTAYYQRALIHHPVTLWRQEEKRAAIVKDVLKNGAINPREYFIVEPELQLHLFCNEMVIELQAEQYQLLQLRVTGYSIAECARILKRSKSWCYLTMKEIRIYCDQWTRI
ncbi:helix-turn-helix domain-containing protein [Weissella ceti]|uniref:Helix-turn-helix domain-containing protein n=1 Tax=Weissella ceti TaxID=759620 RepID=A0ABT3E6A4_9LACO|nr:helix-turn-helix domain-containing protein [Weissella ceti]MCW0953799.1 helix-turn-helix domain-containing protein [Weissella ceti]QVK11896.1 helix-turn-helix domain-containing protein [Weissella ceti]